MTAQRSRECDVLVLGSGVGGLSTAIVATKNGLDCIIAEKEPVYGGTTAFSGGVLWIPGARHCKQLAPNDTRDAARDYLKNETGNFYQPDAVEALLDKGPEMLDWFERETEAKFVPTLYPDYHPNVGGGVDVGRSVLAAPYNSAVLGPELARLRPPLATITFIGMMFNSSNADLKHFFNATKSLTSFLYVTKRLASHIKDLAIYRRGVQVTSGNALVARLAKTVFDLKIPLLTSTPGKRLIVENGAVRGAVLEDGDGEIRVIARRAVVLACGGFPHDVERLKKAYPHVARGGEHHSPTPAGNTGDGVRLAETAGGHCDIRYPNAAAWMPVSRVPRRDGRFGVFPHLLDRYKPGVIAVTRKGKRFCNESESYHDVGAAMIEACDGESETAAWLICDHPTIRKYGLGYAKPAPVPLQPHLASGYLVKAAALRELGAKAGIDGETLERTVAEYNAGARKGEDPQFGRGSTAFNRYLADPEQKPNPCVGPIERGPYYALKLYMGDLGSFDGLSTDLYGQALNDAGQPIEGLYAVGNDRASMMGGNYPGAGITLGPIMTFAYIAGRRLAGLAD
ncbi:MAG: FAD-dependent oxidoreductase [Hyphomicrobiales bacterium]|nr:FAD-dependent oxidoreductase [Hyphomicrobiales bacterium]